MFNENIVMQNGIDNLLYFLRVFIFVYPEIEDSNPVVGLPQLVYDSVMRCEEEVRQDLLNAVILEGGTTMMQGSSWPF